VNALQLTIALERIHWFYEQVQQIRKTETNPVNFRAAVSGYLAEIDRMQLEVREYLHFLPTEVQSPAVNAAGETSRTISKV